MKSRIIRAAPRLFPLLLAACNPTSAQESTDHGEDLAEDGTDVGEDLSIDLAVCDGVEVDRMSDNANCGECGHECNPWWPDTPYAAGGCYRGECGPGWMVALPLSDSSLENPSCTEMCALGEPTECVARGCSGLTGFICFDGMCNLHSKSGYHAYEELTGECDEPVIKPPHIILTDKDASYACCCERPEVTP